MQVFKYAAFWILCLVLVALAFWREPLNDVGTPYLIIIPIGYLLWWLSRRKSNSSLSGFKIPKKSDAYSSLLTACLGDRGKAERLIAYEIRLNSRMTRDQAAKAAADRLSYDRWRN